MHPEAAVSQHSQAVRQNRVFADLENPPSPREDENSFGVYYQESIDDVKTVDTDAEVSE